MVHLGRRGGLQFGKFAKTSRLIVRFYWPFYKCSNVPTPKQTFDDKCPIVGPHDLTYARQTFWWWGGQGGRNGHTWNERSHRLNLTTFATATLLQSVFFGYAKNSSGISEERELLRKN